MSGTNVYFDGKWKTQTFTSNGTFTVPDGVYAAFVELWGGGGAGSENPNVNQFAYGGRASKPVTSFYATTPGANISVTIGAGGASAGADGGDSSFGTMVARGGKGGTVINLGGPAQQQSVGVGANGENGPRGLGGATVANQGGGEGGYGNGGDGNNLGPGGNGGTAAGGGSGNGPTDAGSGGNGICIVYWKQD
jgi:hypothetical protein